MTEERARILCRQAGVPYKGKFPGIPGKIEDLYLFDDRHGSSLALHASNLTVDNIIAHCAESEAKWAGFSEAEIQSANDFAKVCQ